MQIRLVPLVLFAATSLLTLKAFDMVFSGATITSGPSVAQASSAAAEEGEKKEAEAAKPAEKPKEYIVPAKGEESAATSLNEKLGDKRRALDERNKEIELRENILKAAEKKMDDRAQAEKASQKTSDDKKSAEQDEASPQIKNLVLMYESMKPKEAAAIFNTLTMDVLIEVVMRMKPQITAPILAKMATPAAQKLTVELARRSLGTKTPFAASTPAAGAKPQGSPKELPRIDNAPKP